MTETSGERAGKPHYTQNLDKPIPRDGMIRCARSDCDGTVEFREGAKAPFWRCTENTRHRQAYHPSHLRLPKMREAVVAAIGARGLRKLDLAAGVTPSPEPPRPDRPSNGDETLAVERVQTIDSVSPNGASPARQDTLFIPPAAQPRGRGRPDLTPREINVLQQLALHRSRAEIASALGLQPQTVKTYVRDLNRKFGTHDRKDTVRIARALGYI